jgi:large subunit ribosomal protein L16
MLLQPNKTKFKKFKKRYLSKSIETRSCSLKFGFIGLKAVEQIRITSRQIEAVRQCMNRILRRRGKIWVNIFPHIAVTSKPTENRMGKGKGAISYWCVPVKIGTILFEITGVSLIKARQALLKAANKLPIKTRIILRQTLC